MVCSRRAIMSMYTCRPTSRQEGRRAAARPRSCRLRPLYHDDDGGHVGAGRRRSDAQGAAQSGRYGAACVASLQSLGSPFRARVQRALHCGISFCSGVSFSDARRFASRRFVIPHDRIRVVIPRDRVRVTIPYDCVHSTTGVTIRSISLQSIPLTLPPDGNNAKVHPVARGIE